MAVSTFSSPSPVAGIAEPLASFSATIGWKQAYAKLVPTSSIFYPSSLYRHYLIFLTVSGIFDSVVYRQVEISEDEEA
ncbi:unnamed protein product [Thlaspi arvense]|uniref:Uncharacterized protein n=1 Tax=Thlaspi arvense TaxID=13288 RepID=A0AAU9SXP3_THLAR|nr:unnamed protein product [Thlaspi arvense]